MTCKWCSDPMPKYRLDRHSDDFCTRECANIVAAVEAERARCEGIARARAQAAEATVKRLQPNDPPFGKYAARWDEADVIAKAIAALAPRGAAVPACEPWCGKVWAVAEPFAPANAWTVPSADGVSRHLTDRWWCSERCRSNSPSAAAPRQEPDDE